MQQYSGSFSHLARISPMILMGVALSLISLYIYWPSLSGPFLFDDLVNLNALQNNGGVNNFQTWLEFVLSGQGMFFGRPFSFATFTLNAQTWPADPFPFKLTNALIHIFNAWLIAYFLKLIIDIYNKNYKHNIGKYIPMLGAAIWLLHPLHLTSVLQVVQRMTLLSGTFTLLCLIGYTRYVDRHPIKFDRTFVTILTYLAIVGFLGVLSKETAIVTTLFMFALNYTLFRKQLLQNTSFSRIWQFALLGGTLSIFLIGTYVTRGFSWEYSGVNVVERLLTESRILFQYLSTIFLPRASGLGLFHDDIEISTGLFSPLTTLFSVLSIAALIGLAIKTKSKLPFLSLAILWFLLGHIFESTIWPLELYFEHRNYLPLLCLIFLVIQIDVALSSKPKKLIYSISCIYLLLVSFITAITTPVWKDKLTLFTTWAEENPSSVRAQHSAANEWLYGKNDVNSARIFLATGFRHNQGSLSMRLELIDSNCYFSKVQDDLAFLLENIEKAKHDEFYLRVISGLVHKKENQQCASIGLETVSQILSKLESNPSVMSRAGNWIYYHKARVLILQKKYELALSYVDKSLKISDYLGTAILKLEIAYKMDNKQLAQGFLQEIESMERVHPDQVLSELMKKSYKKYKELIRGFD